MSRIDRDIKVNARTYTATYDADGNMVSRDGDPITWTTDNLPASISSSTGSSSFNYDPEDQRYYQAATLNGVTTDTTYVGNLFEVVASSTNGTEFRHNIVADGQVVAVHTINQGGHATTAYLHYDHLGSVDAITNTTGSVIQAMSFDAFGNRRLATNWDYGVSQDTLQTLKNYTDRGYTGEEELDSVSLVDLNGRVYDPTTGRFISADPIMGGNRYAYAYNNPLNGTDPSGYCGNGLFSVVCQITSAANNVLNDTAEGIGHLGGEALNYAPEIAAAVAAYYTGGATTALWGSGFWGTVGTGAVEGATFSGTATALNGGGSSEILDSALRGGAYGGALGALNYASNTYVGTTGTDASVASGAVNGYLQTGTLRGAFLGGVSGLVPYDLWMPGAYGANPWSNFAIMEGAAFIRGGIINGSLQGADQEALYFDETEAAGFAFGYGSELINGNSRAPQFIPGSGAWFFTGANFSGFVTIGNVITGPRFPLGNFALHEMYHATLQSAFGRNYLPVTLLSIGLGGLTNLLQGKPIMGPPAWGAFAEHAPFQACSYTYLYSLSGCPQ